jgi:Ca-activated chloride channel family protein
MIRAVMIGLVACAVLPQQAVFRSGVDAVRVDVSVMNGLTPVAGLMKDNFEIVDNGVRQTIESVSLDAVPLNLMLLLDLSGSMEGKPLDDLIDAGHGLIKSLRPGDSAALMTFSEPIRLAVPLSRDRRPLERSLAALKAEGATSLHDAVFVALQLRPEDTDARPVLLVFSDGRDTASWLTRHQLLEATRRSGVLIHVVELFSQTRQLNPLLLDLADAGGGRRWPAESSRDLRALFGRVLNELRARYLLTYYPAGVSREGWHDVKVNLRRARGAVTARPGYFVAAQ